MTSPERIAALCDAVRYLVAQDIPGDIVECGVWRGGSMMAVAETLRQLDACDRDLYLFDTFDGMPPPGEQDVARDGCTAEELLARQSRRDPRSVWCVSGLSEVRANLAATGYPEQRLHFVEGRVEDTLPPTSFQRIALLRLDTDWYASTKCELDQLFPHLSPGGVLIVDDYGHWEGARRAVDEYFAAHRVSMYLHRIDYTGRLGIFYPLQEQGVTCSAGGPSHEAA